MAALQCIPQKEADGKISKLTRLPALWGFLALCLAFNCLLIGSGDRWRWEWNETAAMTGGLGQRVNRAFLDRLEQRPQSNYRDYLLSAAKGMTDIYEDYNLKFLSNFYNSHVKSSPTAGTALSWSRRSGRRWTINWRRRSPNQVAAGSDESS